MTADQLWSLHWYLVFSCWHHKKNNSFLLKAVCDASSALSFPSLFRAFSLWKVQSETPRHPFKSCWHIKPWRVLARMPAFYLAWGRRGAVTTSRYLTRRARERGGNPNEQHKRTTWQLTKCTLKLINQWIARDSKDMTHDVIELSLSNRKHFISKPMSNCFSFSRSFRQCDSWYLQVWFFPNKLITLCNNTAEPAVQFIFTDCIYHDSSC